MHNLKKSLALLASAALLLLTAACGSAKLPSSGDSAADLRAKLAASKKFYLELRLGEQAVHLCHSGASLRKFPAKSMTVGVPHVLFIPRAGLAACVNRIWADGEFFPGKVVQRVRIVPGDESTLPTPEKAGVMPPTLQDLTPVPPLWRLRFGNAFGLQIALEGTIPGAAGTDSYGSKWRELLEGAGLRQAAGTQIRLSMDAAVGAALYRACPERIDLLVVE